MQNYLTQKVGGAGGGGGVGGGEDGQKEKRIKQATLVFYVFRM